MSIKEQSLTHDLVQKAHGGRVTSTPFLEPEQAARVAAAVREAGVRVQLEGGYPSALRRVVTAMPEHVPEAGPVLVAIYLAGPQEPHAFRAELTRAGVDPGEIGDVMTHRDGLSVIVLESAKETALALRHLEGRPVSPQQVELRHLAGGRSRREMVVVPSLRVDALGAKAFRVSRSYFGKGVAAGKVMLNGAPAGKSSSAEAGDEIEAEELGRFRIESVEGETRKGNLKVRLEVEERRGA